METNIVQSALPIGTILNGGNYTIVDKIGDGGFSIAYRARQNSLNRMVCIKEYFLYGRCTRDMASNKVLVQSADAELFEKYRQSFVHEAETVASLKHSNIVEVLNIFHENGTSYMVMPFIEGQSLESLVSRRGALPLDEAKNYMSQVAEAVGYIHDRNILHRDIKPGNIMITGDAHAILIDFGSAREFVNDKTQAHTSILTRGYAPPEQYSTVSHKGAYSDIYSLGATFYYAVTATPPVDVAARMTEPFPEPASLNPAIPARINNAIMKAMQTNPADRYQDVHSFVSDLWKTEKISGGTQQSTPPVKPDDVQKQRKNKTGLWVLLAALACLIIVVVVSLVRNEGSVEIEETPTGDVVFTLNEVEFTMKKVEGGTFTMGATSEQWSDCDDDENLVVHVPLSSNHVKPAHQVTLSSYYIGETEVTQALWKAVMRKNPSEFKGDDRPVENVSWDDVQTFIERLNKKTGKKFRLPTEAEWEYAARGGNKSQGYKYSGSDKIDQVAWYDGNSGRKTHPVKTKSSNELGLYDMTGNVWEWCTDWYGNYDSSPQTDPLGPYTGSDRVNRGGGCSVYAMNCRVLNRGGNRASDRHGELGFRLVLQPN